VQVFTHVFAVRFKHAFGIRTYSDVFQHIQSLRLVFMSACAHEDTVFPFRWHVKLSLWPGLFPWRKLRATCRTSQVGFLKMLQGCSLWETTKRVLLYHTPDFTSNLVLGFGRCIVQIQTVTRCLFVDSSDAAQYFWIFILAKIEFKFARPFRSSWKCW